MSQAGQRNRNLSYSLNMNSRDGPNPLKCSGLSSLSKKTSSSFVGLDIITYSSPRAKIQPSLGDATIPYWAVQPCAL